MEEPLRFYFVDVSLVFCASILTFASILSAGKVDRGFAEEYAAREAELAEAVRFPPRCLVVGCGGVARP